MPDEDVNASGLSELREIAGSWAAERGERHPHSIRAVATTQKSAVKAIWGHNADAPDDPIYLITLEGSFKPILERGAADITSVWAALFISRHPLRLRFETARPSEAIPDLHLEELGAVFDL